MDFLFLQSTGDVAFYRSDALTAEWTQEELSVNATFPWLPDKVIQRGMVMLFADPATGETQAFEIRQAQVYPDYEQIEAECLAVSELTDRHVPEAIELDNVTCTDAINRLLPGTGWAIGNVGINPVASGDLARGNVWQNLNTIIGNWNVYLWPRVTVGPSGITGRYLDIISPSGIDRGLFLSVSKNVTDPSVTYDDSELYTALYGYGGSYAEGEGETTHSVEYDFASVVWEKTADHPAKPLGQKYIEWPEMTALYGRGGKPRFGYFQNTGIEDPALLLEYTWRTLKAHSEPKISIRGTVTDITRLGYADVPLRLHDMAVIELEPIGLQYYKQITQLTVNLLDQTKNMLTIGDYLPNIVYINRTTESFATGGSVGVEGAKGTESTGSGGGGGGRTFKDKQVAGYQTELYDTGKQIGLYAREVDKHGDILHQAGLHIDPHTGVLIYAEDTKNNLGSKFRVQENKIEAEVYDRQNKDAELGSKITQTVNMIQLEVSERRQGDEVLSGRIRVEKDRITQEVNDRRNADATLEGKITVEANRITQEVAERTAGEATLNGKITVEKDRITQEVNDRRDADNTLSSRITVTSDAITQEVTRATTAEGTLSGRIKVNADKVSIVVDDSYNLKTASIVAGINSQGGSYVKIDADTIDLTGYVTVSQLNATDAKIDNLVSGTTTATSLRAGSMTANSLTGMSYHYGSQTLYIKTLTVGDQTIHYLGY